MLKIFILPPNLLKMEFQAQFLLRYWTKFSDKEKIFRQFFDSQNLAVNGLCSALVFDDGGASTSVSDERTCYDRRRHRDTATISVSCRRCRSHTSSLDQQTYHRRRGQSACAGEILAQIVDRFARRRTHRFAGW